VNTVTPAIYEEIPESVLRESHLPGYEQGFAGSLLFGDSGKPENEEDDDKMGDLEEEWKCPDCTMLNTGSSCAVCDLPNPSLFGSSNPPSPSLPEPELWVCSFCQVPNEMSNGRCIACEKLKRK
jgi:hypothetical protein